MVDEKVIDLRNRFFLAIFLIILFLTPLLFIFMNKFGKDDNIVISRINNNETFTILVINNISNTSKIGSTLNKNNISYEIINTDKYRYYNSFLNKLDINKNDIVEPSIIYIENGKLISILVEINDTNKLDEYIENTYK